MSSGTMRRCASRSTRGQRQRSRQHTTTTASAFTKVGVGHLDHAHLGVVPAPPEQPWRLHSEVPHLGRAAAAAASQSRYSHPRRGCWRKGEAPCRAGDVKAHLLAFAVKHREVVLRLCLVALRLQALLLLRAVCKGLGNPCVPAEQSGRFRASFGRSFFFWRSASQWL